MRFCDIQNNQVRGVVIGQSRRLMLITLTETLIFLDITKTESNQCFIMCKRNKKKTEVMFLLLS